MEKSQTKQALLCLLAGPAGLFYTSVNSALALTFSTLFGVLLFAEQTLYVLLGAYITSVVSGIFIVRLHNKQVAKRDFTLSTYIGRVSCKVIGKTHFKRDYTQPLARAKLKRRAQTAARYSLASLCLLITGILSYPNAVNQLTLMRQNINAELVMASIAGDNSPPKNVVTVAEPRLAAATADKLTLTNVGIWQIESPGDDNIFQARLLGNTYQITSEGSYRPTLTLSCSGGQATINFNAFEVLGTEDARLALTFDTRPEQSSEWALHNDYRSAYKAASSPLLSQLSKSFHLQISYRPFGSSENRSIDFDLGKSSVVTKKLKRQCA